MTLSTLPFELVIFGGIGDLALRKLMPSLYDLHRDQRLDPHGRIIAIARSEVSQDAYLKEIREALERAAATESLDEDQWQAFAARLQYLSLDARDQSGYERLQAVLDPSVKNRIFYLATRSDLYAPISKNLLASGIASDTSKIVLEKPIGKDLASAREVDNQVRENFAEQQIYRIDHYLGKETVQNLLVLRFANTIFESQWNHKYIDHIQITISETLGVEERAEFYENVGALRDMLQNHLLQLLCITAMEPPSRLSADSVRDEKVKVLRALKPLTPALIQERVVRGQYQAGVAEGHSVPGYTEESGVDSCSCTETFVALRADIENWRWAGVPFYLRTGKRLGQRACEIVVHFKEVPHSIFGDNPQYPMANRLVFRLQPDEGIRLQLFEKRFGPGMGVRATELSLSSSRARHSRIPDAYERLLSDVLSGNQTLFVRQDELFAAWEWLDPVISQWRETDARPESYTAGTWGPPAATLLLARDGRLWSDPVPHASR